MKDIFRLGPYYLSPHWDRYAVIDISDTLHNFRKKLRSTPCKGRVSYPAFAELSQYIPPCLFYCPYRIGKMHYRLRGIQYRFIHIKNCIMHRAASNVKTYKATILRGQYVSIFFMHCRLQSASPGYTLTDFFEHLY